MLLAQGGEWGTGRFWKKLGIGGAAHAAPKLCSPSPKSPAGREELEAPQSQSKASYKPEVGVGISPHHRPLQQSRGKTA